MFVRLFAECGNQESALEIYRDVMDGLKEEVIKEKIISVKPYWKMNGIYVVEAELDFKNGLSEEKCHAFLTSIADQWLCFGDPPNEVLASVTTEGCSYMKKGVYLINIHFSAEG